MEPSPTAGYSGTPLARKLGIVEATRLLLIDAPEDFVGLLEPLPPRVQFAKKLTDATDIVHMFATRKDDLKRHLSQVRKLLRANAIVWVSWPKKASKVSTDITEETIREVGPPLGFVDVKVCAVSEVWSGLKLVIRKELR